MCCGGVSWVQLSVEAGALGACPDAVSLSCRGWWTGHRITALADKAEVAGINMQLMDERGTSSTCPTCGSRVPKPPGRVLTCPACQFTGHRDLVAAANIAARAGGGITPAIPAGV